MEVFREEQFPLFHTEILRKFESLGNDCELGLVQANIGVEQPGFFRFNNAPFESLLRVIETEFRDFVEPQRIELEIAINNELIVHIPEYDFRYHTFCQAGMVDEDALLKQHITFLRFLSRKFLDDLKSGRKVFVRKENHDIPSSDILRLARALSRYRSNRLLWVKEKTNHDPLTRVERVSENLAYGYLDSFCTFDDASIFSFQWYRVLQIALQQFDPAIEPNRPYNPQIPVIKPFTSDAGYPTATSNSYILENAIIRVNANAVATCDSLSIEQALEASVLNNDSAIVCLPAAYNLIDEGAKKPAEVFDQLTFQQFRDHLPAEFNPILLIADSKDFTLLNSLESSAAARFPCLRLPVGSAVIVKLLLLPK